MGIFWKERSGHRALPYLQRASGSGGCRCVRGFSVSTATEDGCHAYLTMCVIVGTIPESLGLSTWVFIRRQRPQKKQRNYVVIKKVIRACLCYVGRNAATVLDAYAAVFVGQTLLKRLSSFRACLCDVGCNATAVMDAYVSVLSVRLV